MAKETATKGGKKRRVTTETVEEMEPTTSPETITPGDNEAESPEMDSVVSMFSELGSREGLKVNVYRMPPVGQKGQEFCFSLDPTIENMDMGEVMERLQSDWGAGRYLIVARDRHGIVAKEMVRVAASRGIKLAQMPAVHQVPAIPDVAATVTAALQAALAPLAQMLAPILQRMNAPAPDPMEQFSKTFGLVQGMLALQQPRQQPDTMAELEKFAKLRALMGDGNGDGGGGDIMDKMLKAWEVIGKPMMEGMAQARAGMPAGPAALPAMPGSLPVPTMQPAPPAPGASPAIIPAAVPQASPLQVFVARLSSQAKTDVAPEQAAHVLVEELQNAPDTVFDQVCDFVERNDAVKLLTAQAPELAQSHGWLTAVRTEFLRLTEDDTAEESSAVPEGEAADSEELEDVSP